MKIAAAMTMRLINIRLRSTIGSDLVAQLYTKADSQEMEKYRNLAIFGNHIPRCQILNFEL